MTLPLLVGGYTERLPHVDGHSPGILSAGLDGWEFTPPAIAAEVKNPSWITATRGGDAVYAVEENDTGSPGAIVALRRDPSTGRMTLNSRVSSGGTAPAHLALSPAEDRIVTANYGSGTLALHEILPDKGIGALLDLVQHDGCGLDRDRQEAAHPHQIVFEPGTARFLVPDLGADAVFTYELDGDRLTEVASERLTLPAGTGPRHLVFHPDRRHLMVLGELSATIDLFTRSDPRSPFAHTQRITILEDPTDVCAGAEVVINRAGDVVFAGNRGPKPVITMLRFDGSRSELSIDCHVSAPAGPRAMLLVDTDRLLLVAGQDSDEIVAYAIDPHGACTRVASLPIPSPACLVELRTSVLPDYTEHPEQ